MSNKDIDGNDVNGVDAPLFVFPVYKEQYDKAKDWRLEHDKVHILAGKTRRNTGAIGGAYSWIFTSTSLGVITNYECSCGESICLTDFTDW